MLCVLLGIHAEFFGGGGSIEIWLVFSIYSQKRSKLVLYGVSVIIVSGRSLSQRCRDNCGPVALSMVCLSNA